MHSVAQIRSIPYKQKENAENNLQLFLIFMDLNIIYMENLLNYDRLQIFLEIFRRKTITIEYIMY